MNLGGAEILVIIVIAVMVLGPDKLPNALRMFGKTMGEIKKYQDLAKGEINKAMDSAQFQENKQSDDESQNGDLRNPEPEKVSKSPKPTREKPLKEKIVEEDSIAPILDEEDS